MLLCGGVLGAGVMVIFISKSRGKGNGVKVREKGDIYGREKTFMGTGEMTIFTLNSQGGKKRKK